MQFSTIYSGLSPHVDDSCRPTTSFRNELLNRVISLYNCTPKSYIFPRYLAASELGLEECKHAGGWWTNMEPFQALYLACVHHYVSCPSVHFFKYVPAGCERVFVRETASTCPVFWKVSELQMLVSMTTSAVRRTLPVGVTETPTGDGKVIPEPSATMLVATLPRGGCQTPSRRLLLCSSQAV